MNSQGTVVEAAAITIARSIGASIIANAGLLEKTGGTGAIVVASAVDNTGTMSVTIGTLDITGAVTGAGQSAIAAAGTLEFAGSAGSGQTIAFAGTSGGKLMLNDPSGSGLGFYGMVRGFGGADTLDLPSFAYAGTPTLAGNRPAPTMCSPSPTVARSRGSRSSAVSCKAVSARRGMAAPGTLIS